MKTDKWWLINKLARYQFLNRYVLRWILELIEFVLVIVSGPLACLLLRELGPLVQIEFEANIKQCVVYGLFMIAFWFAISQISLMAISPRSQRFLNLIFLFIRGYFFISLLQLGIKYLFNLQDIPIVFIVLNIGLAFTLTLGFRILSLYFLRIFRASGHNLRNVLIIGDVSADFIIDRFQYQKDWGYEILGIISQSRKIRRKFGQDIPILTGLDNLEYILVNEVIDEVFYCTQSKDESELRQVLRICDDIGIIFRVQANCGYLSPERLEIKTLTRNKGLVLMDNPAHSFASELKTLTDFIFSFFALLLLIPVLILVSLAIKLESRGPVFYKQERIGLRGRKFILWKFRTMIANAEVLQDKLKAMNEADGPVFKIKDDPRITRFGRILRKTGVDEIPQLLNVLRGEMSLIGPRPPVEAEVREYQRWQLRRLSVKPGITCTWQIQPHRNDIRLKEWVKMDLNYIDNWSLAHDFKLVLKTITALVFATGR